MSELVDMYILHKKRNGKMLQRTGQVNFMVGHPPVLSLEAQLLQQVYALDQTQMQPKIVMPLSAF